MIDLLIVFVIFFSIVWFIKTCQHPKDFPPGPRLPLPFMGDSYTLGKNLDVGLSKLTKKYGSYVGFWLGPDRTILISDFDVLKDVLGQSSSSNRQILDTMSKYIADS